MQLFKKSEAQSSPQNKTISETKCTCNVCGKVWHYGKTESLQNAANAMNNLGKAMMCCGGCAPALLVKDKKVTDLKKCPQCGSKNIKVEQVSYEVAK